MSIERDPEAWKRLPFESCTKKVRSDKRLQSVQSHEYQKTGKYPVVDQGAKLIAGFTDRDESIYSSPLPVVIFGDHTRVFKYVDFPFAPGADGTKIIVPEDNIDCRFFYFALSSLDIPNRGYNRHFKVLKDQQIKLPPFSEQRKIGELLAKTQQAIAAQQAIIDRTNELKKALMEKLFSEGLRGEPARETPFGKVPKKWAVQPLDSCAKVQTGTAKGRKITSESPVSMPYLRVANVQDGYLDLTEMKTIEINPHEKERYLLKKDDVVLTEGGDFDKLGRGFIWRGEVEECIHQNHIFAVRADKSILNPSFFAYMTQSVYGKAYFLSVAHKTTNLACINTAKLKRFPVLLPELGEQETIVAALNKVDAKIAAVRSRHQTYTDLFTTLLHDLMTGRIRTTPLMEV